MTITTQQTQKLSQTIKDEAKALGFDLCRITSADLDERIAQNLKTYIDEGYHASMDWMVETFERRKHPKNLWAEAKSIILLGMNYGPEDDPRKITQDPSKGAISVYAQNRDYHDLIKGKLKTLASKLVAKTRNLNMDGLEVKVFVDTAPVMEKPLAQRAGLGWQGKHTNLVSPEFGSWLFLGSIFTNIELPCDQATADHCGTCTACLDHCPTKAFPAPYKINANRCISYLTIEHHGAIADELRPLIGNRIYGCDDCLSACPWNKFAQKTNEIKLTAREDLKAPDLKFLAQLDDPSFRTHFSGSPIKRIGRDRFIRNVLIAIGNSGDKNLIAECLLLLKDASPYVRGAAIWAYGQLEPSGITSCYEEFGQMEEDPDVKKEWQKILERK